ncbi:MAG: hypothetical protein MMC33_009298 [Icmadophila ericetorum]|nr:hypothetical protein [Icmadophila ericetorum]
MFPFREYGPNRGYGHQPFIPSTPQQPSCKPTTFNPSQTLRDITPPEEKLNAQAAQARELQNPIQKARIYVDSYLQIKNSVMDTSSYERPKVIKISMEDWRRLKETLLPVDRRPR